MDKIYNPEKIKNYYDRLLHGKARFDTNYDDAADHIMWIYKLEEIDKAGWEDIC